MAVDPRWAELPTSLGPLLAVELDVLSDEVMRAVQAEVSLYDRPLEGSFGRGIALGVREALRQFCLLVQTNGDGETGGMAVYEELGRGEWRHGRPLDALLAAYRVGARVAWRRFALVAVDTGLRTEGLVVLAELVFAHIDGLSAASAEGFAAEQSAQAGERDRLRLALLRVLLATPGDTESIAAAARLAAWPLPAAVRVILAPAGTPLGTLLGPAAVFLDADPALAVVGDPPPYPRLASALAGTGAVVGPVRGVDGARLSQERAAALLRLRLEGHLRVPAGLPLCADYHLPTLLLWADPQIAADLARTMLKPLESLTPAAAARLTETLRAWLRHGGERAAAAAELHVHPQTVRYRLTQLRDLLGDVLENPDARVALMMAAEIATAPGREVIPRRGAK